MLTLDVPAVVGIPLITRVVELKANPAGNPLALYVSVRVSVKAGTVILNENPAVVVWLLMPPTGGVGAGTVAATTFVKRIGYGLPALIVNVIVSDALALNAVSKAVFPDPELGETAPDEPVTDQDTTLALPTFIEKVPVFVNVSGPLTVGLTLFVVWPPVLEGSSQSERRLVEVPPPVQDVYTRPK